MKVDFSVQPISNVTKQEKTAKDKDPFDLDLRVSVKAQKELNVNDPTPYCGSDDDCTGCGCNTCCSSC